MSKLKNCFDCANCQYIGEGDYYCDMHDEIVASDWEPTEKFNCCKGKDFTKDV